MTEFEVTLADWAPEGVDMTRASAARMYDYYLGGSHNFAVDREMAEAVLAGSPITAASCLANRAFLRRVVRYFATCGITQFLDIGSGIPTVGNVHEIAHRDAPDARIVYVDIDPIAVAHGQRLVAGDDRVAAIQQDLRRPRQILADPQVQKLIDFNRPVAVMLLGVLHFVSPADNPAALLAVLREALAPGSYLALSHGIGTIRPQLSRHSEAVYQRTAHPLTLRTCPEVVEFFAGFEVVEPGVVWVQQWRPDRPEDLEEHPERLGMLGGVARLV